MSGDNRDLHGFTLIELVVVISIMALLTTFAALTFAKPIRATRARDAIEQVRSFDASARAFATRFGKDIEMVFDLSEHRMFRRDDAQKSIGNGIVLPRGCSINQVRFGDRLVDSGEIAIPCSRLGLTRSYSMHLAGPGLDRWISVAGLSGEMTVMNHEPEMPDNFDLASRNDAD